MSFDNLSYDDSDWVGTSAWLAGDSIASFSSIVISSGTIVVGNSAMSGSGGGIYAADDVGRISVGWRGAHPAPAYCAG